MHTETSDRGMSHNFIGPGAAANGLRGLKTRWSSVCSFSISSEYTKALSVPQIKKTRRIESGERAGCTWNTLCQHVFFILLCEELTLHICPSILCTPVYSSLTSGTAFHTHTKQQAKLNFSLSQYLRPWISTSRHRIYNLLVIRHSPTFLCTQF